MQYIVDRKWKWVECNLVIKRLPQKQYQEGLYESLEAQVQLISEQPDIKNFQSDIIMEKTFQFQEGRGFIWHKSWYIPEIVVKLSSKITKILKEENHIKKMYCEMLSGYPFKKDEHYFLQQVRLQGETVKQFTKKGQVSFSNVKFWQTSFNKNKNKFSIILVIYTSYKQNQKSIIKSYVSSPIHVDSRKQARKKISANTFMHDQLNINKFINGLEGAEKIVNQTNSYEDLLTIQGFIKYYTAANIRFKVKHPYYIGYHFSNVFDVYYNNEQAEDPVKVLELIYESEGKETEQTKGKPKPKKEMFTDNKQILKKACPKVLLFLIKNMPKQCLLIKEQLGQGEQKIDDKSDKNDNNDKDQLNNQPLSQKKIPLLQSIQQNGHRKGSQRLITIPGFLNHQQYDNFQVSRSINKPEPFRQTNNQNGYHLSKNRQQICQVQQLEQQCKKHTQQQQHINNNSNNNNHNRIQKQIVNNPAYYNPYFYYQNYGQMPLQQQQVDMYNGGQVKQNIQQPAAIKLLKPSIIQQQPQQQINIIKQQQHSQQQSSSVIFQYKRGENGQLIIPKQQQLKIQMLKQQQSIKKIFSIFQSWKFNFVHLKKSDGGLTVLNKKWKHIEKEQLLESFKEYVKRKAPNKNGEFEKGDENQLFALNNGNNYLTYDLHQVIVLQKSKQGVKIQENHDDDGYDV